jgi:pilus assembly protein CpaC
MAGLLKEDSYSVVNKIPLLGDLPVIGTLFTSKQVEKDETELVIMVTPRLVKPLNPFEVASLPGDRIRDNVSDVDFFLLNRTDREAKINGFTEQDKRGFVGKIGFEM